MPQTQATDCRRQLSRRLYRYAESGSHLQNVGRENLTKLYKQQLDRIRRTTAVPAVRSAVQSRSHWNFHDTVDDISNISTNSLGRLLRLAETLFHPLDLARANLYSLGEYIALTELTLSPLAGGLGMQPESSAHELG